MFPETGEWIMSELGTPGLVIAGVFGLLFLVWLIRSPRTLFGTGFIISGLCGLAGAVYTAIWLMLVGGIIQIVDACKETPTSGAGIAWGIVRVIFTPFSFWLIFFVSMVLLRLGMALYDSPRYTRHRFILR